MCSNYEALIGRGIGATLSQYVPPHPQKKTFLEKSCVDALTQPKKSIIWWCLTRKSELVICLFLGCLLLCWLRMVGMRVWGSMNGGFLWCQPLLASLPKTTWLPWAGGSMVSWFPPVWIDPRFGWFLDSVSSLAGSSLLRHDAQHPNPRQEEEPAA